MKKLSRLLLLPLIFLLVIGGICYYIYLPAVNIHSRDFWIFLFILFAIMTTAALIFGSRPRFNQNGKNLEMNLESPAKKNPVFKLFLSLTLVLLAIYVI